MACTPKPVRRNGGVCTCPRFAERLNDNEYRLQVCRHGCCTVLRCYECHGELTSWGPIGCRHLGDTGKFYRSLRHRGMKWQERWDEQKRDFVPVTAWVKPSIARRQRGRG